MERVSESLSQPTAVDIVAEARRLFASRSYDDAIMLLTRVEELEWRPDALLLLAKALVLDARYERARVTLHTLLSLVQSREAYRLLIRVCLALDDLSGAASALSGAIERFPDDDALLRLDRRVKARLDRTDQTPREPLDPEDEPTAIEIPQALLNTGERLADEHHADELPIFDGPPSPRSIDPEDAEEAFFRANHTVEVDSELIDDVVSALGDDFLPEEQDSDLFGEGTRSTVGRDLNLTPDIRPVRDVIGDALCAAEEASEGSTTPLRRRVAEELASEAATATLGQLAADQLAGEAKVRPASGRGKRAPAPLQVSAFTPLEVRPNNGLRDDDSRVAIPITVPPKPGRKRLPPPPPARKLTRRAARRLSVRPPRPVLRWWIFATTVAVFAAALLFVTVRRHQASETLHNVQALAVEQEPEQLKGILKTLRHAANLGGRSPEVLLLASEVHGRLALNFGESSGAKARALLNEAKARGVKAGLSLLRASAYDALLALPAPQAVEQLAASARLHPDDLTLRRLYAHALFLAGQREQALAKLTEATARDGASLLLEARVRSALKQPAETIVDLLSAAEKMGVRRARVALMRQRLLGVGNEQLTETGLTRGERAWVWLLRAEQEKGPLARTALTKAYQLRGPLELDFVLRLLVQLRRFGRLEDAQRLATDARRRFPGEQSLRLALARLELALERPSRTVRLLESLQSSSADEVELLGQAYLELKRYQDLRVLLAKSAVRDRRYQLLAARLELASERYEQVERLLDQYPEFAPALTVRAAAWLARGDVRRAEALIANVERMAPSAESALLEAQCAQRAGDQTRSIGAFKRAVERAPYRASFRLAWAEALLDLERLAEARRLFEDVLNSHGDNLRALRGRALTAVALTLPNATAEVAALERAGDPEMAQLLRVRQAMLRADWQDADRLLSAVPEAWLKEDSRGLLWQAKVLSRRGRFAAARRLFYRAMRDPRHRAAAEHALSQMYFAAGDVNGSLRHARAAYAALKLWTNSERLIQEIQLQIARCYRRLGQGDKALEHLTRLHQQLPYSLELNRMIGEIYLEQRQARQSVPYLAAALKVARRDSGVRRMLALACSNSQSGGDCYALGR
ncbi:MAG: tetratricopeptide repeat protein [Deltaproteobacteria bacterium]|nr:tetratricopeptide repeat protein [Deltaproteobacteria bacterium]